MTDFGCAVTGATGYLGSGLATYLEQRGVRVVRMSQKSSPDGSGAPFVPFRLGESPAPGTFRDHNIKGLVHCAYDFSLTRRKDIQRVNVEGAFKLTESARNEGVERIVFISSMSAFDGCRSLYGQAKLAIEKRILEMRGAVLRPGLIYSIPIRGAHQGGLFGELAQNILNASVVPVIGSRHSVQYLVDRKDVCKIVLDLMTHRWPPPGMPITAASENPVPFAQMLLRIASLNGRSVRFVHVPWRLVWSGLWLAEKLGLRLRFRSDSVIGFIYQNPHPDFSPLKSFGISLKDFHEAASDDADILAESRIP